MLISLDWLKQYVDIDENIKELENTLTMIGQEVEAIEVQGAHLDHVVVGQVVEYGKHPDSEKLSLLKVDAGDAEPLQIICGAPNHKEGDKVVVAKIGAILPGDFKIKKAKVRGVESFGMLCSEVELGIGEDADGIIILPEDAPVGTEYRKYMGLDDTIFELEITPNRPDCLSHVGIAREVAAYYGRKVKYPKYELEEVIEPTSDNVTVDIQDKDRCKRYTARVLKNVKVGESPEWLKKRLRAIGLRPINNIVDVTNFVMFEYNHPMHAFDLQKLSGNKIIIREAEAGEKIVTLDGEERELNNKELVIADEEKAVAIAGIMGGENTQVDEETTDLLLEVAYFTPENIRKTSKALGLSSDSSYRFERGIDRDNSEEVINRAASLMKEVAGGEILNGNADKYIEKFEEREVTLDLGKLNKFVGKEITLEEVGEILRNLGLEIKTSAGNIVTVCPPSYRGDLTRTADLYEEVIRMYGFENIEDKMPVANIEAGNKDEETMVVENMKGALVELGLQEVINYSFIPVNALDKVKVEAETISIKNPLNEDMTVMRPTLIYSLLSNVRDNFNRNQFDLNLFEVSRTFTPAEELANEELKVAIALAGRASKDLWDAKPEAYDFYDLKGYVENFLGLMGMNRFQLARSENPTFHPGRSADIKMGKDIVGTFGEIHPDVAENMGIKKERAYVAELDVAKILKYGKSGIKYERIVKFPEVTRDLAILVDADVLVGNMVADIKKSSNIIENVELFDVYVGERVEEGKKSVAVQVSMRKATGTLEEKEITGAIEKILGTIKKRYNGEIRQ
ncbi:phenylalanine--tRNA ligase beta subunit [Propionigenium maris DSM 9537]|uniref:Phenylalanine--tRNA ligase beta subunit n=1 Tax=Propionigenium maris DSM 9537 TaxID=1123000 RepID=A0A9W6GP72_9FUSO|nr:phenylalanine--tRNA ligase subunit beta [Propionigenium maris]GLI58288.1 phenylalanine--tRNA ligase beta subunit [Propionigenium maris DSM 9537]